MAVCKQIERKLIYLRPRKRLSYAAPMDYRDKLIKNKSLTTQASLYHVAGLHISFKYKNDPLNCLYKSDSQRLDISMAFNQQPQHKKNNNSFLFLAVQS